MVQTEVSVVLQAFKIMATVIWEIRLTNPIEIKINKVTCSRCPLVFDRILAVVKEEIKIQIFNENLRLLQASFLKIRSRLKSGMSN